MLSLITVNNIPTNNSVSGLICHRANAHYRAKIFRVNTCSEIKWWSWQSVHAHVLSFIYYSVVHARYAIRLMVAARPLRVVWGFDQPFLPGWRVHGLGRALGKQSMSIEALGPHRPLPQRVWVICCCSNTKNPSAAGFLSIHASFPLAFSLVMFVWESGWEYWKQPSVVDDCTGADNRS